MGSVCVRLADLEMRRARFGVLERYTAFSRVSWILKCGLPVSGQGSRAGAPPPPGRPRVLGRPLAFPEVFNVWGTGVTNLMKRVAITIIRMM